MPETPTSDLGRWMLFLDGQGFSYRLEDWPARNPPLTVIRFADEKRFCGFNGYAVGIAFKLDGTFYELGGWG